MIKNLSGIDTNREEGRLLVAALDALASKPYITKPITPDEVLIFMHNIAEEKFQNHIKLIEEHDKVSERPPFVKALETLLNSYSMENGSNTPDFVLAEYLQGCLHAYEGAVKGRDKFFNLEVHI